MNKDELQKEIVKVNSLIKNPNFEFPHVAKVRLKYLERSLWDVNHPFLSKIRRVIGELFITIGNAIK